MVGHTAGIDRFGTDPYFRLDTMGHYQMPKTALIYQGATPTRETVMMLQAVCGDFRTPFSNPVWAAGTATSVLMRGVRDIDFYRLNYYANISPKGKQNPAYVYYKKWFKMIRALEPLGLAKAKPPKDVALLYSRAGNDWWELKENAKNGFKKYPNSAMAGYAANDAVMKVFFTNGQPFDLYYLDQSSSLENITKYKVVVIPFAYSISEKVLKVLQTARDSGVKILIVDHFGEVNEFGTPYPKPILKKFATLPGVEYLGCDPLVDGTTLAFKSKLLDALDKSLGENKSFFVSTFEKDIEVGLLKNAKTGRIFIPVVNWTTNPLPVDLGLKLNPGAYGVKRYSLDGISKCSIDGKQKLTAADLRDFRVQLPPSDTSILVIEPKQ
jgi:hypothetical protein